MSSYRQCSDGQCWLDWEKYKNPKITNQKVILRANLGNDFGGDDELSFTLIDVPSEQIDWIDGSGYSESGLIKAIKSYCNQFNKTDLHQMIKKRVLRALNEMTNRAYKINFENEATAEQIQAIKAERTTIRKNVMKALDLHCR